MLPYLHCPWKPDVRCLTVNWAAAARVGGQDISPLLTRLPGAAGQLRYVLAEGLRCELQAFDHRQVGEQLVGEFLYRHAVMNRQCRRLYQFTGFRGD